MHGAVTAHSTAQPRLPDSCRHRCTGSEWHHMGTTTSTDRPADAVTSEELRLIHVGVALAGYLKDKFGVDISAKTLRGRCIRPPVLQVVYFLGQPYTTPTWSDAWLLSRLRDQPPHGRCKPRPPLAAMLREQFRAEEAAILAMVQTTELTDRERAGDVWNDAST